jgi:hypothetical protein
LSISWVSSKAVASKALALAAALGLVFIAAMPASADYQVPPIPKLGAGQAGLIIDSTAPADWTEHLTAGGYGGRKGPEPATWFDLSPCQSPTEIYCIAGVSLDGKPLTLAKSVTALDNDPLPTSVSKVRTGSISLWDTADKKQHFSVNSFANFTCDLCTIPDVSSLQTDIRAYKTIQGSNYKALSLWDVYASTMGGQTNSSQQFRNCAWLDQGQCGQIISLPTGLFSLSLRLPSHLHTSNPGADLMKGHLGNLVFSDLSSGDSRLLTVAGNPASVPFFSGVLKPVPSWAKAGQTSIVNPENGLGLPITASGKATGENLVWQFDITAGHNTAPAENCLSSLHGVISAVSGDSPSLGALNLIDPTTAVIVNQDYPRSLTGAPHISLTRFYLREDAAGCFATGDSNKYQALTASATHFTNPDGTGAVISQDLRVINSANNQWQTLDLIYDTSGTAAAIKIQFKLESAALPTNPVLVPPAVSVEPKSYTITCSKKSGKKTLTAKVSGLKPVCPKGFSLVRN